MTIQITSERFEIERGFEIAVQVPEPHAEPLLEAIQQKHLMPYGHYDQVSFQTQPGRQRFRSLPGGRNAASDGPLEVSCVEVSFFVGSEERVREVVEAIYAHHPYEEPVIFVRPVHRTLHRSGVDEDNPRKFWNRDAEDWVPTIHRNDKAEEDK